MDDRTDMGGPTADLSITESVSAMKRVVEFVRQTKQSNGLYMYDGSVAERYPTPQIDATLHDPVHAE